MNKSIRKKLILNTYGYKFKRKSKNGKIEIIRVNFFF